MINYSKTAWVALEEKLFSFKSLKTDLVTQCRNQSGTVFSKRTITLKCYTQNFDFINGLKICIRAVIIANWVFIEQKRIYLDFCIFMTSSLFLAYSNRLSFSLLKFLFVLVTMALDITITVYIVGVF